ncbi:MAG TPA: hypothetical protein VFZ95_10365 [Steroidobacteraceae bacterium]
MSNVPPVFNGEAVALASADPLWFAMRVADGLNAGLVLVHKDPPSDEWVAIDRRVGNTLVQVQLATQTLHGDSIGWVVQCQSVPATNLPVFVQLCQGVDANNLRPLTRVARYDVTLVANESRMISDAIQIQ